MISNNKELIQSRPILKLGHRWRGRNIRPEWPTETDTEDMCNSWGVWTILKVLSVLTECLVRACAGAFLANTMVIVGDMLTHVGYYEFDMHFGKAKMFELIAIQKNANWSELC